MQEEPPTRVLPLSLLCKEIHPLLRFWNDKNGATRPKPSPPFEKGGRKLPTLVRCEHNAFNRRAYKTKNNSLSLFSSFLKDGVSGKKSFF